MIVQVRDDGLRLVRQHDHAMAAGELAHAWRPGGEPLPFRLVAAVALHDVAWRPLDEGVRFDPATGRPHDFASHPLDEKLEAYRSGLDEMEEVDPWAGLLGSHHYASFLDEDRAPDFLARERRRRERLRRRVRGRLGEEDGAREAGPAGAPSAAGGRGETLERRLERHLSWLKFFDGLSLRICLTPPAVPERGLPPWLDRGEPLVPPTGGPVRLRWEGGARVALSGAPLAGPVGLVIPVRDLGRTGYADAASLDRAWRRARERTWRLEVAPGG